MRTQRVLSSLCVSVFCTLGEIITNLFPSTVVRTTRVWYVCVEKESEKASLGRRLARRRHVNCSSAVSHGFEKTTVQSQTNDHLEEKI